MHVSLCVCVPIEHSMIPGKHDMAFLCSGIQLSCQNSRRNIYSSQWCWDESGGSRAAGLVFSPLCCEQTNSDRPDWCLDLLEIMPRCFGGGNRAKPKVNCAKLNVMVLPHFQIATFPFPFALSLSAFVLASCIICSGLALLSVFKGLVHSYHIFSLTSVHLIMIHECTCFCFYLPNLSEYICVILISFVFVFFKTRQKEKSHNQETIYI